MLKSFRISNFRNLVNVEFRPVGLNLLIGPNNAGKTNLCAAMRFLSLASRIDFDSAADQAAGERWNIGNVYVNSPSMEFELRATLEVDGSPLDFAYTLNLMVVKDSVTRDSSLRAASERLVVTGGSFQETVLLECQETRGRLLDETAFRAGNPAHEQSVSSRDGTFLSRVYDEPASRTSALFKRYLQSWQYFNLNPQSMRSPLAEDKPVLYPDGSGLSRCLYLIHNAHPRLEKRIIEAVRVVEPHVDLLSYQSPDPRSVYLYMEDAEGHRFGAHGISDGTLRYLATAYLIHSIAESRPATGFSPVIMIEEPENGLYVGYLKPLIQMIDTSGKCGQFVFTSHSPYFVDLFEDDLKGVHVFRPGKPTSIVVTPDEKVVKELLEKMPLGEMHFREILA